MANYKKPGRPPKKRDWKQEQRFTWVVDFFKFPSVHTFIHQNSIEAVLPEFERLLRESGNASANTELHHLLLNAKRENSFGQMPSYQGVTPNPSLPIAPMQEVATQTIANTPTPARVVPPPMTPVAVEVQESLPTPVPQEIVQPPKRNSILDD